MLSNRMRRATTPYVYQAPAVALLVVLMLLPIFTVIKDSLYDNVIVNKHPVFIGLQNYSTVLSDGVFLLSIGNTLYFTVMSVIFHLALGLAFAMLLNSKVVNPLVRGLLRALYIVPWVFTATIIAIIWRLLLNPSGIINYILRSVGFTAGDPGWFSSSSIALHAVTFVNIWAGYPFYLVSLLAGLQGIPKDLYEAATIDGANAGQRFVRITIPQLSPIIISVAMLDFIWTVQVFPLIWLTTGGGPIHTTEVLGTFTYKLAFASFKFSLASASAVVMLILSMCIAYFYVRNQRARY